MRDLKAQRFTITHSSCIASETGTVIRVFSIPSGERLHIFRRGTYAATVFSLAFDENASMLAASSDTGTIHVFNLSCTPESSKGGQFKGSEAASKAKYVAGGEIDY